MAIRITPDLENTESLLGQVLSVILKDENRVAFLCPADAGSRFLARLRVMLMRKRKLLERKGKKVRRFTMRSTVHPETHGGRRYDCVVIWCEIKTRDWLSEQLEDLMTHG